MPHGADTPTSCDAASPRRRGRLLAGFLSDVVSRDVHQVAQIQRSEGMQRLLQLLAGQVAGILNVVLEDLAGRVVGIEVKAAMSVRSDDFRGLRVLRDKLGDRFHAGFVLYCGHERLSFGGGLGCLPISALWTTAPGGSGPIR